MKKYKKPSQGNHEIYFLPEGLEVYAEHPAYIVVALWCLGRKEWINRNDIARAFKINGRRASYFLSYITKKKTIIKSRVRKVRNEGSSVYYYEIKIDDVRLQKYMNENTRPLARVSDRRKKLVGNATDKEKQLLHSLWSSGGKKNV